MHYVSKQQNRPVVFFDGGCPLCSKEIAFYQKRSGAKNLEWIDISSQPEQLIHYGISYESAMKRFHVLDHAGSWQTGAWGFVELWSHFDGYRWLSRLLRTTRTIPLADRLYSAFAGRRYRQRCNSSICKT